MEKTIKIDFIKLLKMVFGFEQNNVDNENIKEELENVRKESDGISWEEFHGNSEKKVERKSPKFSENRLENTQQIQKSTVTRKSKGLERE